MKYYIDCEFDGHGGPLMSMGIICEDGKAMYILTKYCAVLDPWVIENVQPYALEVLVGVTFVICQINEVGKHIRDFVDPNATIIADSPVDIGRFCSALSTESDGHWCPCDYEHLKFEVINVDCYPTTLEGAVQHNAWWDAMALREKLRG